MQYEIKKLNNSSTLNETSPISGRQSRVRRMSRAEENGNSMIVDALTEAYRVVFKLTADKKVHRS